MTLRRSAVSTVLAALAVAGCSDSPTQPEADDELAPPVAEAISDGANGGNENFRFGLPLGFRDPFPGPLNADLAPRVEVCRLVGHDCGEDPEVVASFDVDDLSVDGNVYRLNWDTDGPETDRLRPLAFYRIRVLLGDVELGFADVNPRLFGRPAPLRRLRRAIWRKLGFLDFRIGQTIPIRFWIGEDVLCDSDDPEVIECEDFTIRNDRPFAFVIDQEGVPIGVEGPAGILPQGVDFLNITIERLDVPEGECLEGIDSPVFGPCGRITTSPELTQPLNFGATVAICVDPQSPEFALVTGGQFDLLQIHRQEDDGSDTQILTNFPSEVVCGDSPVPPPADNFVAQAVGRVIRSVEALFAPRTLYAADLGLGGLTRRFSRFQWSLPCRIEVLDGVEGQTGAPGAPVPTPPGAVCRAANGQPVNGARIRFEVEEGNGTLVPPPGGFDDGNGVLTDVTASPPGVAAVGDWILGDLGANSLRLFGTGLLGEGDDFFFHSASPTTAEGDMQAAIPTGEVSVNATAVEEVPAVEDLSIVDGENSVGPALEIPHDGTGSFDLRVRALQFLEESEISLPVEGAEVTWTIVAGEGGSLDPQASVPQTTSTTNEDGEATATFFPGEDTYRVTASSGDRTVTYTFVLQVTKPFIGIPDATGRDEETGEDLQTIVYLDEESVRLTVEVREGPSEDGAVPTDGIPVNWSVITENGDEPVTGGSFKPLGNKPPVTGTRTLSGSDTKPGRTSVEFYFTNGNLYEVEAFLDNGRTVRFFIFPPAGE